MPGRLKTAFVSGTILNNPLLIGGTTLSSNELSTFPAVVSPDIGVIVLDPRGTAGAPEVVWVTAHTAAATTATITRGQEGTAARQHLVGVAWVHGPTIMDMNGRKGTDIASAATITLPNTDEDYFHITGTTTITAISAAAAGRRITLEFDGICQLTHNGTSFILFNGLSITTVAGECYTFVSEASGNWRLIGRSDPVRHVFGSAGPTNIGTVVVDIITISLTRGTWYLIATGSIAPGAIGDNLTLTLTDSVNAVAVSNAMNGSGNNNPFAISTVAVVTAAQIYKFRVLNVTTNSGAVQSSSFIAIKLA